MEINDKEKQGTIHELPTQLVALTYLEKLNPKTTKARSVYTKKFEQYGLFPKNASAKEKREIIDNIITINFKEDEIVYYIKQLDLIKKYNRIIDKTRRKVENEILAGKDVKKNNEIIHNSEKIEVEIPRPIREALGVRTKSIRLIKYRTDDIRNKIKFYSGQPYYFLVKDGFTKPYLISYKELQKIRKQGNVVKYILDKFKLSVDKAWESAKRKYAKSKPETWKAKQIGYKKIYKVIEHNLEVATNKKYNKKLIHTDKEGKIIRNNSEYPVMLDMMREEIEISIP